jgi:hypothetical protein
MAIPHLAITEPLTVSTARASPRLAQKGPFTVRRALIRCDSHSGSVSITRRKPPCARGSSSPLRLLPSSISILPSSFTPQPASRRRCPGVIPAICRWVPGVDSELINVCRLLLAVSVFCLLPSVCSWYALRTNYCRPAKWPKSPRCGRRSALAPAVIPNTPLKYPSI